MHALKGRCGWTGMHIELYVAQMYLIKGARTHEWGLRTVLAVDKLLSIHLTLIVSSEE